MKYAAVAVVLLAAIAAAVIGSKSSVGPAEPPPCAACRELYADAPAAPVDLVGLARELPEYNGRVVRLHAQIRKHGGRYFLPARGIEIPVAIDPQLPSCGGTMRRMAVTCGFGQPYDGRANVDALARVEKVGNDLGLTLVCLERAAEPTIRDRIRYATGGMF